MKVMLHRLAFFMAIFAMGNFVSYGAGTHFNETLPDPSANTSVKPGAMIIGNGYDYGLSTDLSSPTFGVISNGLSTGQTTTQALGGGLVAQSTSSTQSGNYSTISFPTVLAGTTTAIVGDVLCSTVSASGLTQAWVCPAVSNLITEIGVALNGVSTGSVVNVGYAGVALVLTTDTVNAGDVLVTSTGAVQGLATSIAQGVTLAQSTTTIGIALSSNNSGAQSLIPVRLH